MRLAKENDKLFKMADIISYKVWKTRSPRLAKSEKLIWSLDEK